MELVLFVIAGITIIVIFIGFFFNKAAVIKRRLRKSSYKKISEIKNEEIAKIVGNVELIEAPLISPLSNRMCSFYYVHIEQNVSTGKNSSWKTIIEEEVSSKFLIREANDYAFINDKNLKCFIVQDRSYASGFLNDATSNLEEYLKKKGIKSEGFLGFNKTLRYKEGVLEDGEEIAVFGRGNWKEASKLNLPDKYGRVLEICSTHKNAVHLSDDPSTTIKKVIKQSASKRHEWQESHYRK